MNITIDESGRQPPIQRGARPLRPLNNRRAGEVRAMGETDIAWSNRRRRAETRPAACRVAVFLLASASLAAAAKPAHAQINLGLVGGNPVENTVCMFDDGQMYVVGSGDCGNQGESLGFPSALTIGPNGSQTSFNAGNGSATFGATSTFDASATFNSGATFNAGVSATTGTFSGTVTMNGGLAVGAGQTVDMGGNRVQNVGGPVAATDATNKDYVDGLHNLQQTQINQHGVRLTNVENVNTQQDTRLTALESSFSGQAEQIAAINQNLKSLSRRDGELADGIAISLALAQPAFQVGQRFALRGGWGNFDGSNALGVSAAGLLYSFRNGGSVVLDVGVGASMRYNMFAGRGGVTIGW